MRRVPGWLIALLAAVLVIASVAVWLFTCIVQGQYYDNDVYFDARESLPLVVAETQSEPFGRIELRTDQLEWTPGGETPGLALGLYMEHIGRLIDYSAEWSAEDITLSSAPVPAGSFYHWAGNAEALGNPAPYPNDILYYRVKDAPDSTIQISLTVRDKTGAVLTSLSLRVKVSPEGALSVVE